ncbi:MAG: phosphoribosylformylglycinamidine cyclo-ligase [candidate division WOR-3 bacterium]
MSYRTEASVVAKIIEGLAAGCRESGCALIGGETAEMPDFYAPGEYDVAGFIVGLVDRANLIDGRHIEPGDVVIGMASLGLHTNGFSLARKLLFEIAGWNVETYVEELGGTVGQELLKHHKNYLPLLNEILTSGRIKGIAHITGGGFLENIPRILPERCGVEIYEGTWPVPPIFRLLERLGNLDQTDMYRTFNMGIGMILIASKSDSDFIFDHLRSRKEAAYVIGEVVEGDRKVIVKS